MTLRTNLKMCASSQKTAIGFLHLRVFLGLRMKAAQQAGARA